MSVQQEIEHPSRPQRRIVEVVRHLPDYHSYVETSPEGLAQAQTRVAEIYKEIYAAPDRPFINVLIDLCRDEYSRDNRSRTIVLRKPDTPGTPEQPGQLEDFAGTVRLVLGKNRYMQEREAPIDELNLMSPGTDWLVYLLGEGLKNDEIAGLGRLAFADDIGIAQYAEVLQRLMGASFSVAREEGVKRIFAIVPRQMVALLKRAGYEPTIIPDAKVQEEKRKVKKLQENYPFYWGNPKKPSILCYWDVDQPAK